MFPSIVLAILTVALVMVAQRVFEHRSGDTTRDVLNVLDVKDGFVWTRAGILGFVVWVCSYFLWKTNSVAFAWITLAAMIGSSVYLGQWWAEDGSTIPESLCFVALEGIFLVVSMAAFGVIASAAKTAIGIALLKACIIGGFFGALCFFACNALRYNGNRVLDDPSATEEKRVRAKNLLKLSNLLWIVVILVIAAILIAGISQVTDAMPSATGGQDGQAVTTVEKPGFWEMAFGGFAKNPEVKSLTPADTPAPTATADNTAEATSKPSDSAEVVNESSDNTTAVATETNGASTTDSGVKAPEEVQVVETAPWYGFYNTELQKDQDPANDYNFGMKFPGKNAEQYYANLKERMAIDPALGAAIMGWHDVNFASNLLTGFYDESGGDWTHALNRAKVYFALHQREYYEALDAVFASLDSCKRELRTVKNVKDMMFMDPYTVNGVPDIIFLEVDDAAKKEILVFIKAIKGENKEAAVCVECGYQPCNTAKAMKATPKKPASGGSSGGSSHPSGGPTPTPARKDPTQGTNVGKNNTTGAGTNTNNGNGGTQSTQDAPTNSGSYGSYEEYRAEMDRLNGSSPTATPSPSNSPTATPSPSNSPTATPKPSSAPTATSKPSSAPTATPKPSSAPATSKPSSAPSTTASSGTNVVNTGGAASDQQTAVVPSGTGVTGAGGPWGGPPA